MAIPMYEETATSVEMAGAPMAELDRLRERHKDLLNRHNEMRANLLEMLAGDCKRLEYECKSMADAMAFIRQRQPNTNMTPAVDYGQDAPSFGGQRY